MSVIFDLDQTLIDTSISEKFRKSREWKKVYELIPKFKLYDGITNSLSYLKEKNIPICIVTSSPSIYCDKVIKHWEMPCELKVCYHDTKNKKPHPDPILKALTYFNNNKSSTLSFGDRDIDIISSNTAGVISVACYWGCVDINSLEASNPRYSLTKSNELLPFLKNYF